MLRVFRISLLVATRRSNGGPRHCDCTRAGMTTPWRSAERLRFPDRRHAGAVLARQLQHFADRPDLVVLALPRGGVPVAYEVARALGAPMDVFVVRKLGMPGHPELAMGAIASGGVRVMNEDVVALVPAVDGGHRGGDPSRALRAGTSRTRVSRWSAAFTDRRPHRHSGRRWTGHRIDDASGGARDSAASASPCRRRGAGWSSETCEALRAIADEVVCALMPEPFSAVGLWYVDFSQTTDDEVRQLLSHTSADCHPQAERVMHDLTAIEASVAMPFRWTLNQPHSDCSRRLTRASRLC